MDELFSKKEVLTREQVMECLKISRSTFYKLLREGRLQGYKEGNRYKVLTTSVNAYIAGMMQK